MPAIYHRPPSLLPPSVPSPLTAMSPNGHCRSPQCPFSVYSRSISIFSSALHCNNLILIHTICLTARPTIAFLFFSICLPCGSFPSPSALPFNLPCQPVSPIWRRRWLRISKVSVTPTSGAHRGRLRSGGAGAHGRAKGGGGHGRTGAAPRAMQGVHEWREWRSLHR